MSKKLTKEIIKKLVMEQVEEVRGLEESAYGTTHVGQVTYHDGSNGPTIVVEVEFPVVRGQPDLSILKSDELEQEILYVAEQELDQYADLVGDEDEDEEELDETGMGASMSLHEGKITKSVLQKIILEERSKLLKEGRYGFTDYDVKGGRDEPGRVIARSPGNVPAKREEILAVKQEFEKAVQGFNERHPNAKEEARTDSNVAMALSHAEATPVKFRTPKMLVSDLNNIRQGIAIINKY
jgi:hypothetical protein